MKETYFSDTNNSDHYFVPHDDQQLGNSICQSCGQMLLDMDCEEFCGRKACDGGYGNCCNCGNEYLVSSID